MMKKAAIFDLDGTLIDSYEVIIGIIFDIMKERGRPLEKEYIERFVKEKSVREMVSFLCESFGFDEVEMKQAYAEKARFGDEKIRLMPQAGEMLRELSGAGVLVYLYTHKGKSTSALLRRLDIYSFFDEIITGDMGFERKPSAEAVDHLIEKHELDKENTYYVGDRDLDVECAKNAGIKSILLKGEFSSASADYSIDSLLQICEIVG